MLMQTVYSRFKKARSVNQTSSSFVSKIPTGTEPAGDAGTATGASIIDNLGTGGMVNNQMLVAPYAVASDNNTGSVRVIGWGVVGNEPTTWIWVPVLLAEVAFTLDSTLVGVAGRDIVATEMFADTLSVSAGNENVSVEKCSPADGVSVAHFVVDLKGFKKIELSFSTGGVSTSCNALYKFL